MALLFPSVAFSYENISSIKVIPSSTIPKPAYLGSVTDPAFGASITRVTDPGRAPCSTSYKYCRHHYSSSEAWNADQSLVVINKGASPWIFLNGSGYGIAFTRKSPGECEWHPTNAALMICVKNNVAVAWDVRANQARTVLTAAGYSGFTLGSKGNPSRDGRYVAVRARNGAGQTVAFAIDMTSGAKSPDIQLSSLAGSNSYVSISPTGTYIFAFQNTSSGDQGHVFTRQGVAVQHWLENHRPGHGDMTIDADGQDVMVGVSKSAPDSAHIIKRRLADGKVTDLTRGRTTLISHVSARDIRLPGWVFVTSESTREAAGSGRYAPMYQEVDALRIDGSGEIRRLVQHHSVDGAYTAEAHGSPSPDGTRVIFASDWGDAAGTVAAYAIAVPW